MNPKFISCRKALAFLALAALTLGVRATPASADTCGKGKISNVTPATSTLSGGNQFWNVLPGSTVTITLSCVTDCANRGTDATIQVIVQSSASGNKCLTATKVSTGVYTFTYCVPLTGCQTDVISYCTTGCSTSTGYKALDAGGKCPGHLRVASSTGADCTPQISGCPTDPIDLGCNPKTLPTCDNAQSLGGYTITGSTSCSTPLPVSCTAGSVTSDGCNRSQKFTYAASNDCGQTASCTVTFKWQVVTAPVFDNCTDSNTDLGCNPKDPIPSCDASVTAQDECGSVSVSCDVKDTGDDCTGNTRTITYTATNCAGTSTCVKTYTWTRRTVTVSPPDDQNVCLEDVATGGTDPDATGTATAEDSCGNPVDVTYEDTQSPTDANGCYTITRKWTATISACDVSDSRNQIITVCPCTPKCVPFGQGCTVTLGFWKTHGPTGCVTGMNNNQWPVTSLTLGTVNYSAAQLCSILQKNPQGNGLVSLAHQLIAALLNVANNAVPDAATAQAIIDANNLIGGLVIPPVGSGFLAPSTTSALTSALDAFNRGGVGPGHCDDNCPQ